MLRDHATFAADFPDDVEFDDRGNLFVPGGKHIASFLSSALAERGMCTSHPRQHSFYGWAFEITNLQTRVWCLLQFPGPWLLLTEVRRSIVDRALRRRREAEHRQVLQAIHQVVTNDDRFRSVRWYTQAEYNSAPNAVGSDEP